MSFIHKALQTWRKEGFSQFFHKTKRFLNPRPEVSNQSTFILFWYLKYVYSFAFGFIHGFGTDVMEEDWDTLILLDACRYDDFERVSDIDGELSHKISKGVDSPEFIKKNFVGKDLTDTVYVTANPYFSLIGDNTFHETNTNPLSKWDSELQCVRPEAVTTSAINAHKKHPNKRIIVHYMQPHDPPLGPKAKELRENAGIISGPMGTGNSDKRIMELVAAGEISKKEAHEAYRETLDIVLEDVTSLIDQIDGKIVISADHGEMFGERPYPILGELYEHFQNPKTISLCKVPWHVVESYSRRRQLSAEPSSENDDFVNEEEIEKQLKALGYK